MSLIRRYPFILCCILTASLPLQARQEHIHFRRLSQGLSQSTVNTILQDRRGFMWFGTQDGLNRFDGYSFTVFRHNPSDTNSIADNYIWTMVEDRGGELWIGTLNNGLSRYAPERGEFRTFVHAPGDTTSLSNNNVTALCQGPGGEMLIGTWGGGLQRYDSVNNRFIQVPIESKRVRCMVRDRRGSLWVGTWNGLVVLDAGGKRLAHYIHDGKDPESLSGDRIIALFEDTAGAMWVGTYDSGLNRFDRASGTFQRFPHGTGETRSPGSDAIRCISGDRNGRVWIGTLDGGIDRLDPGSMAISHFRSDPFDPDGLSSNRVFSLCEDKSGAIWVGTGDAGICRYDPLAHDFAHFKRNPSEPGSLSNNVVRAILETSGGELWIGTFGGGLNRRLPGSRGFIRYSHDPGRPTSLSSDAVLALFEDSRGDLWIGTGDAGLDRFDKTTGGFRHYRHDRRDKSSLSNDAVMAIMEDRSGRVWLGTSGGGADIFDRSTGTFAHFHPGTGSPAVGNDVWAIHEDRSGSLWMGTWGEGLERYDSGTGTLTRFMHDPAKPGTVSNNTVWSIYEDASGMLWFATWGGGLDRFDPAAGKFKAHTEADGLPNNVVYGILPDNHGNLWLSTNKGVSRFTPSSGTFRNYDALDGLQADEFNQGAYCRGRDGTLYFGGVNGVNAFQPDSLRDNPAPPPVVITGFQVFNRPVFANAAPGSSGTLSLSYRDNFFSFEFAALNYTAPEKNRYAYKLEGFDGDWVYSGTRRYVSYTHLSGGDYVFRVKGSNSDGIWNEDGISLPLHIDPPFYLTWPFMLAVAALIALATYLSYRLRITKLLAIEKLRTRIASDLHDDIGSGLTRIAVLSDVALHQAGDIRKTADEGEPAAGHADVMLSIGKVGAIARELVDAMSDVVWSIDPRHDTAGSLMQRVKVYALELCEAKNIALSFETLGERESAGLSPEIMRELLLVAKEAVTNIVRHSGCSGAQIRLVMGRKEITLEVEDNGRGFVPSGTAGGNGLLNMQARAVRAGGSFTVDSAPGTGTRLHISLPNA
jgi:ligand-binding sensor domain-containing protein/signal transduction histidine kinase